MLQEPTSVHLHRATCPNSIASYHDDDDDDAAVAPSLKHSERLIWQRNFETRVGGSHKSLKVKPIYVQF